MKYVLAKNPIVTILCSVTCRTPDEFKYEDGAAHVLTSKKPEVWKKFSLPLNTLVAWHNFDQGFAAPHEVDIGSDNLYYTDWDKKGLTFAITKK